MIERSEEVSRCQRLGPLGEERRGECTFRLFSCSRENTPGGVQPAERGKGRVDAKGHVSERDRATKRSDR